MKAFLHGTTAQWILGALLLSLLPACSIYEFRKRPDQSEVAVLRSFDKVLPNYASEVELELNGLDEVLAQAKGSRKIVQLYETKDQLTAQIRDLLVVRYQSYINAELDSNPTSREKGRDHWNSALLEVHRTALELRKIKQDLQENKENVEIANQRLGVLATALSSSPATYGSSGEFEVKGQWPSWPEHMRGEILIAPYDSKTPISTRIQMIPPPEDPPQPNLEADYSKQFFP